MSSKSLRSLMKDRQLAKRIQHQFAKYDSLGRLTCTICDGLNVKSEPLWPSHLNSKPHRVNYQRYLTSLKSQTESDRLTSTKTSSVSKRKSEDDQIENTTGDTSFSEKKIRFKEPSSSPSSSSLHEKEGDNEMTNRDEQGSKTKPPKSSLLPDNFFDNPSEAPQIKEPMSGEGSTDNQLDQDDPEWQEFQAALQLPFDQQEDTSANLFAQASVIAEPVLYQPNQSDAAESINNTQLNSIEDPLLDQEQEGEQEEEEDPIEKKIREEREEIMDRIQNEEREQLEADQRVLRMKARVEAFRAKRKKPTHDLITSTG